ncbi:hypothetical protein, partial [Heyndrickxia coagulans]|uniref:hypothetical protein n=1 Tax=Heyndrickxia coagulans TaxID=1398 RepID=UPI00214DEC1F
NYQPSNRHLAIKTTDGSLSEVDGVGSIFMTNTLTLRNVLYPNISCNLLSVSKLVKYLNCVAHFTFNICTF